MNVKLYIPDLLQSTDVKVLWTVGRTEYFYQSHLHVGVALLHEFPETDIHSTVSNYRIMEIAIMEEGGSRD